MHHRQGEILLVKMNELPKGKVSTKKSLVVGHSETGHHHVLESDTAFEIVQSIDTYFRLKVPAKLVHQKTTDQHGTQIIQPGVYRVVRKNEYDPYEKVLRSVQD